MAEYEKAFARYDIRVGQVLMSAQDTMRSARYRKCAQHDGAFA